jgi:hypothetical protein
MRRARRCVMVLTEVAWHRRGGGGGGGLTVLGSKEGIWWSAAAPVRFYGTDEGRRSLGTSQMKKNDTRGGAHRRGRGGGAPAQIRQGQRLFSTLN